MIRRWLELKTQGRKLILSLDQAALSEVKKLDACHAIKTVELEMRPIHVRLESSTRGHVLAVMLAHRLIQELQHCWAGKNLTVEEGIKQLSGLCVTGVIVNETVKDQLAPERRHQIKSLLELAKVE